MSKNITKLISPRNLCTSIKNRVPSWFDRSTAYYNCMSKIVTKLTSPRVLCTSVTNRVLSWFDLFTAYYNCMYKNVTKTHISATSVQKYHRSCSQLIWPFYGLLELYEQKYHKTHIREFCAQVSKIVFLADLTVLRLITNVCTKMSQKFISPRVLCTSIKNRVLSWIDRFTAYKEIMSKKITKLISQWSLCTSITNQVLSWFDRFTPYYYSMSRIVTKLISPRVLCTSITDRVSSWLDRFISY